MIRKRAGFSLTELVIVVMILSLFALFGIPQYKKSIESSKADDALSLLQMIATTNRLMAVDTQGVYAGGDITDACTAVACSGAGDPRPACDLVACKYLAAQPFNDLPYDFDALNGGVSAPDTCGLGAPAGNYVACCKRNGSGSPGAPYANWGYTIDRNGAVLAWNNAPPPSP